VAGILVMVWAVRIAGRFIQARRLQGILQHIYSSLIIISGFLLFRVLKMGSDTRFDDIRSFFWKFLGAFSVIFLNAVLGSDDRAAMAG